MKPRFILCGAISSTVFLTAVPSNAVTLSVLGGTGSPLPFDYDLAELTPGVGPGTSVQRSASLVLDEPGFVTFSYSSSEAANQNQFWANEVQLFDNQAAANPPATQKLPGGLLPFFFREVASATDVINGVPSDSAQFSLALFKLSDTSVFALFNDGGGDEDFDDMAVRVDVAPIPVPSAAWLLLTGLLGFGVVARRRKVCL